MKKLLFFLFAFTYLTGIAQTSQPCEELLAKEVVFEFGVRDSAKIIAFWTNFKALENCGLDSMDLVFFSSPAMMGTLLMRAMPSPDIPSGITYLDILNEINEIKKEEYYSKTRDHLNAFNELARRKFSQEKLNEDILLLENLALPPEQLEKFLISLNENPDTTKFYKELLINFSKSEKRKNKPETLNIEEIIFAPGNLTYQELLDSAEVLRKPLLLYFTGYACVNCRKMEQNIFLDPRVFNKLKKEYFFVSFYVDDKKVLPESEWLYSERKKKTIKYKGEKYSEWQIEKFKVNSQPYFVIIGSNGEAINNSGYTQKVAEFLEFLN